MKIKNKKIIATAIGILFFPLAVFAQKLDWGIGYDSSTGDVSGYVGSAGSGSWGGITNPYGLPEGSILDIVSGILFWLLSIFALVGIIGFIISGIIYLVSAGDENTISRAKTAMMWSIVGVIVGLSGFVIMQAVAAMLSGASTTY